MRNAGSKESKLLISLVGIGGFLGEEELFCGIPMKYDATVKSPTCTLYTINEMVNTKA